MFYVLNRQRGLTLARPTAAPTSTCFSRSRVVLTLHFLLQRQAKAGLEHPHPQSEDGKLGVACTRIDTLLHGEGGFDFVMLDCETCEDAAVRTWDFKVCPAFAYSPLVHARHRTVCVARPYDEPPHSGRTEP